MVQHLETTFHELAEPALPLGLHEKIMRSLLVEQLKYKFGYLFIFVSVASLLSVWRVVARMLELESVSLVNDMWSGFELSAGFVTDFGQTLYDALPLGAFALLLMNMITVAYISHLYLTFGQMQTNKGRLA